MDEEGQILEVHPSRPGSTTRAPPEHAHLRDSGRVRYVGVSDEEARGLPGAPASSRGSPALEPAHAIAWLLANPRPGSVDLVTLSGRGDKDLAEVLGMTDRIAAAFAGHDKRAALMPYLMGGYPDLEESRAAAEAAAADAGADLIELGIPFSDPLADGPVIHAVGTRALANGATLHGVLEVCERVMERLPVVLMVYANVVMAGGAGQFARRAASAGAAGLDVPDLPHDEAGELRAACDAEARFPSPVAPTTTEERMRNIGADARGSSMRCRSPAPPASATACCPSCPRS